MSQESKYDVIIVGGSYSGLAAGMALGRALRKTLIVDNGHPCNKQTPHSHNFLTHDGRTPEEITRLARAQVAQYSSVVFSETLATAGKTIKAGFEIRVETGETFTARKLILATGIRDIMPEIPGFAECWGVSALHCPYCHGYEVRAETTGILANGDTGFEMSALIANWTKDITLYTNGKSTFTEVQKERLRKNRINTVEAQLQALEHDHGYLRNIVFSDGTKAAVKALYARLPFVQHSTIPEALGCELTPEGYIKTDPAQRTTVHGVYACGDNTTRMRTVANAVSMGTTTGIMVNNALIDEDF